MTPLDRDSLTGALEAAFDMPHDDAAEIAETVLHTFADREEVDDETIDAELRSVFYTLEAKRMLSFRREEVTRESGDKRRAFYWRLRREAFGATTRIPVLEENPDVYASLPSSAWRHAA